MQLYKHIVKHIMYPIWMAKDGKFSLYKYTWQYRGYGSLSYDQIRERQLNKLEAVLKHAWQYTDYYRTLFKTAGIGPDDLSVPVK